MRWSGQKVELEAERTLPGLETERIRTFDAPEALDIRFHEVRAKSALNRVPGTYLPFNYTVNAFRGCSHACSYCLHRDTAVLMGDARTLPISDLRVGDQVYGTVRDGSYRRFVKTEVLAHWRTEKPAYRIALEDGTELIASGDHRFLSGRGKWKHVTGAEQGVNRRPHLTVNDKLMGVGSLGAAPEPFAPEYRRGYLCGMIRGGLDFLCAFDRPDLNGVVNVRINGGLRERLRFIQAVDPAITRKRWFEGAALKSNARLGVTAIEPLGKDVPMFDITTGTGDFIANGVVSHNCFARNTHTYLDLNAGRDFEREIVVKVNVPELLRAELRKPSWKRELVAFGTNTDPYQWAEGRYRLMPPMLEALRDTGTPASILTKSSLAMRDLELFKQLAEVAEVSVNFSVPTLEERAWRETEPHTPHPRKRLEAVGKLNQAGIPSGVLIAPLMPGINDDPEQVEEIVSIAEEAGATFVNGIALHLRPGVKEVFMDWLRGSRPELAGRYERLYARGAYAPRAEQERVSSLIREIDGSGDPRFSRRERFARLRAERREQAEREAAPSQTSLF